MVIPSKSLTRISHWLRFLLHDTGGTQIVEFAVVLPLLMVVTVGIYDFGSAFTVKEKLVTIAQTGARVGASQPGSDLPAGASACPDLTAVCAVRDVVDRGLLDARMNDCGLRTATPITGGGVDPDTSWHFDANGGGCPAGLTLLVERALIYTVPLAAPYPAGSNLRVAATRITLSYPYQWQFNKVIGLLGGVFNGPAQISTVAVMQNTN